MGFCLAKPIQDDFSNLFSDHPERLKALSLYPAFSNVKIVQNNWYLMAKVEFSGLPHETTKFLEKWRQRKAHPHLFLIHKIFTDDSTNVVMYLDYPESIVTELEEEQYLHCLDSVVQIMASWQKQGQTYCRFGRDSVYTVHSFDGQYYYKVIDAQLHPYLITFYRKCWLQNTVKQIEQLLNKFYLSPIQLEALSNKVEYPQHNLYKTDVFCFGLFLYKCLTQDDDLYDFQTFQVKLEKITQKINDLKLQPYAKMFLLNMLQEKEENRPDFIQLDLQFSHFAKEVKYERKYYRISDMLFDVSKIEILELKKEEDIQIINEEIQAYNFDQNLDFENLHFSITSNTNPTAQIHKMVGKGFHSQMILNNNQSKCAEMEEGVKRITRIDLPCLGYADLSNWKTAEGLFVKGMLQGYCRLTFSNGDKFEGFFEKHKANGKGSYMFHNNTYYKKEGNWRDNKFCITI